MSRARSIGRGLVTDVRGSAEAAAAGAVAGFVAGELATRYDFFRKAWYVTPGVTALAGHLIKGNMSPKLRNASLGVIGGAGTMAYYNYKLAQASGAASGTQGVQDGTGAIDDGGDYVRAFQALPEAQGVQSQGRSSVMGLQTH